MVLRLGITRSLAGHSKLVAIRFLEATLRNHVSAKQDYFPNFLVVISLSVLN